MWKLRLIFVAFALGGVGLAGGGVYEWHQQTTGPSTTATVSDCHYESSGKTGSDVCTGSWMVGGSSLLNGGRFVFGRVDGADHTDLNKTVAVHVHGGTAYMRQLRVPIILMALGGCIAIGMLLIAVKGVTPSRKLRTPTTSAAPQPTT